MQLDNKEKEDKTRLDFVTNEPFCVLTTSSTDRKVNQTDF